MVLPSASLIPYGDPTLLLTSAGMVQFKPYFTGKAVPPSPRVATCQKCFRTSDIESVGDPTHLTFFEMLGNFSFGNYFKQEAITWAWEYVLQHLKIPEEKLWVTVFEKDDEAFNIWRRTGVAENRIVRLGEEDNFWGPAGSSGPCGPCSEIHYDLGKEYGCGKPDCKPGCDCKRYTEIWNLVFTEFNQDENGQRTRLSKPNIDTGMGLERTAAVLQGKSTVYDTDVFAPLLKKVAEMAGKKHGENVISDNAMRVVVEHGRSIAFLLADGVMPGKEGRGYVLRRILRRAEYFGETLAHEKPFLTDVAEEVVNRMGHIYPELTANRNHILNVVRSEVDNFRKVLPIGRGMLENALAQLNTQRSESRIVSGHTAFTLHDTYGFPIDLTREIAASRGFSMDMAGFESEMEIQRERAKAAQKFSAAGGASNGLQLDVPPTQFVGYDRLSSESKIVAIIADGESVGIAREGQTAGLVLDTTPFYGEMGGQVGDTGIIKSSSGTFTVTDTVHFDSYILHRGQVATGNLTVDSTVRAGVDAERRLDIARNHTATHLLQNALRRVMGTQVQQRGSLVTPERLRFDFSQLIALSAEQIQQVQRLVNDLIRQDLDVYAEELSYTEAIKLGAIAIFEEKYGNVVRVLKVGKPPVSLELCGGTHVKATGQIGYFHIISESSIGSGLRRIEAVTGRGAELYFEKLSAERRDMIKALDASQGDVLEKMEATIAELETQRKYRQATERKIAHMIAETLLGQVEQIEGVNVIAARVDSIPSGTLLDISDFLRDKLKSAVIVLGTVYEERPSFLAVVTPDLVSKGYHAGNIVKQVAKIAGGSGGGKPTMAQAGGKDKSKVDEALRLVKSLISSREK